MLIIRGVNVFPLQIESVLFDIEGTEPHYQLIVDRHDNQDKLTVKVEVNEALFFDAMRQQRTLVDNIRQQLAAELGISVDVKLVEERSLERYEGKACRVIDNRKL